MLKLACHFFKKAWIIMHKSTELYYYLFSYIYVVYFINTSEY